MLNLKICLAAVAMCCLASILILLRPIVCYLPVVTSETMEWFWNWFDFIRKIQIFPNNSAIRKLIVAINDVMLQLFNKNTISYLFQMKGINFVKIELQTTWSIVILVKMFLFSRSK